MPQTVLHVSHDISSSVVAVDVAPDLKTCKAYISVLGDEESQNNTIKGLKSAAVVKNQLSKINTYEELEVILEAYREYLHTGDKDAFERAVNFLND